MKIQSNRKASAVSHPHVSNHKPFSFAEYIELAYTGVSREIDYMFNLEESLGSLPASTLLLHNLVQRQRDGEIPEIRSFHELLGVALCFIYPDPGEWGIEHLDAVEFVWEGYENANRMRRAE
jgi:hypothetical protein